MQIDQNSNTQSQQNNTSITDQAQQRQSSQKVSENEAEKFADQLKKKDQANKPKNHKNDEEEQSLDSIFAEQSKHAKSLLALQSKEANQGTNKDKLNQLLNGELERSLADEINKDGKQGLDDQKNALNSLDHNRFREQMDSPWSHIQDAQLKADMQMKEIQKSQSIKAIEAALQKMADQIHVSAKDAVNGAEIRITIKDTILPGTEVRINRHGGELTVTMNTSSLDSHNFLAQHAASLQKQLDERFSTEIVQLSLDMAGDMNDQGGDNSRNEYVEDETVDIDRKNKRI
ncbi:MAG: type III secretion HpaP family protein [Endozoicomonas sp. (ex Botrylloides leachii)]|nr:type III secretion HpaP family protein [Endozoicomonas sp. (ex Botrylloides leachii)]